MKQAITFDDVLLIPNYNHYESRKVVDISNTDRTGNLKLDLPVFTANMDTITESSMASFIRGFGGMGVLHRFMSIERNIEQFQKFKDTFVSVGCSDKEFERFLALKEVGADKFCVDVAHGHAKYVGKMIKKMKQAYPGCLIMAGNVATYAGADYLASVGADLIKVGIGPGSVCTTRIKTGFGVPQLTAIEECAKVDRSIVADGGIRTPGDVVKALAFGADFVMVGGMLAGTEPSPGKIVHKLDKHIIKEALDENTWGNKVGFNFQYLSDNFGPVTSFKEYRGMASKEAADDHLGGLTEWKTAEGVSTQVLYKNLNESKAIIQDIIGGLRSGLTYAGASDIKELQRKLNYTIITNSGLIESKPHKDLK